MHIQLAPSRTTTVAGTVGIRFLHSPERQRMPWPCFAETGTVSSSMKQLGDVSKPTIFIDFLYEWADEHPDIAHFDDVHQGFLGLWCFLVASPPQVPRIRWARQMKLGPTVGMHWNTKRTKDITVVGKSN